MFFDDDSELIDVDYDEVRNLELELDVNYDFIEMLKKRIEIEKELYV